MQREEMMKKNIWLIRTGEILPCDEERPRLFRMGLIGEICSRNPEHQVTWWCSVMNHFTKEMRPYGEKYALADNYLLRFLPGPGYRRNMSFRRLYHQFYEARRFVELAEQQEQPDVILCSMPTPELAYYVTKYARKHGVPVFVDIRDTFPDMYVDFAHSWQKPLMRVGIKPYQWMLSAALKRADGLLATSEKFLQWGLGYAKRSQGENDRVYYVSYPDNDVKLTEADMDFWYQQGIAPGDFVCCFFGQFGFTVDLDTVMQAALLLAERNPRVKLVICGVGEKVDTYKAMTAGVHNVIFPGWVDRVQICALGQISAAGLLAYRPGKNYEDSMPNKFCEYLALGQALLIQPEGMMLDFATRYECGVHYSDAEQLCQRILELAEDRDRTGQMQRNARRLYEESFCAEHVYSRLVEFLLEHTKR